MDGIIVSQVSICYLVTSPRIKTSKESSKDTVGYIQVLPGG